MTVADQRGRHGIAAPGRAPSTSTRCQRPPDTEATCTPAAPGTWSTESGPPAGRASGQRGALGVLHDAAPLDEGSPRTPPASDPARAPAGNPRSERCCRRPPSARAARWRRTPRVGQPPSRVHPLARADRLVADDRPAGPRRQPGEARDSAKLLPRVAAAIEVRRQVVAAREAVGQPPGPCSEPSETGTRARQARAERLEQFHVRQLPILRGWSFSFASSTTDVGSRANRRRDRIHVLRERELRVVAGVGEDHQLHVEVRLRRQPEQPRDGLHPVLRRERKQVTGHPQHPNEVESAGRAPTPCRPAHPARGRAQPVRAAGTRSRPASGTACRRDTRSWRRARPRDRERPVPPRAHRVAGGRPGCGRGGPAAPAHRTSSRPSIAAARASGPVRSSFHSALPWLMQVAANAGGRMCRQAATRPPSRMRTCETARQCPRNWHNERAMVDRRRTNRRCGASAGTAATCAACSTAAAPGWSCGSCGARSCS